MSHLFCTGCPCLSSLAPFFSLCLSWAGPSEKEGGWAESQARERVLSACLLALCESEAWPLPFNGEGVFSFSQSLLSLCLSVLCPFLSFLRRSRCGVQLPAFRLDLCLLISPVSSDRSPRGM